MMIVCPPLHIVKFQQNLTGIASNTYSDITYITVCIYNVNFVLIGYRCTDFVGKENWDSWESNIISRDYQT